MIEQLTIERLTEYGFTETNIERLQNWDGYKCFCHNDNGFFWASNVEHKIYSGKEASRGYYFNGNYISFPVEDLDLVPEYYELRRSKFIESQRQIAGAIFNEKIAKERFRENEMVITKNSISDHEKYPVMPIIRVKAEKLKHYLIWLDELKEPAEAQPEIKKLTAPAIALFCNLVNKSSLDNKLEYESVETFCTRVCEKFNLPYTDRVRQTFSGSNNKANTKMVVKRILPLTDKEVTKKITDYLDNNEQQKQKIYN